MCPAGLKHVRQLWGHLSLNILSKKTPQYHHCNILSKHDILNFDNFIMYADVHLIFKMINNTAPPSLMRFVQLTSEQMSRITRLASVWQCSIPMQWINFLLTNINMRWFPSLFKRSKQVDSLEASMTALNQLKYRSKINYNPYFHQFHY